jgi:LysR family glycine cleavage system transcriptional activator
MRDIKLSSLRICLEVLRRGNLTATADALNLTQSAVSKSVQLLEAQIGVSLFRRTKTGLVPYDHTRSFLADIGSGISIIDGAVADLAGGGGKNTLRIVAPPIIAQRFIIPNLEDLGKRHPEIELLFRVRTSSTRQHADTDAEISFSNDSAIPSNAQLLAGGPFWIVCHPDLVPARLPLNKVLAYPLLQHTKLEQAWLSVAERHGLNFSKTKFHYYEQYNLIIEAILQKQGIAILPRFLVSDAVRSEKMRRIGEDVPFPNIGYYFVVVRSEKAAACQKLFRWLHSNMKKADRP